MTDNALKFDPITTIALICATPAQQTRRSSTALFAFIQPLPAFLLDKAQRD
tara:strand:- start:17 stop:169 length:153 start_codon:yes stop_codon:yes gene_type:complete